MNVTVIDKSSTTTTTTTTTAATSITTTVTTTATTTAITGSSSESTATTTSTTTHASNDVVPDAVPHTNDTDGETSKTSTVAAIVTIILIVACVGLAVYFYKKRQRKRPDARAAVVYDQEARVTRDTANMMRSNSGNDVSIRALHIDDPDNRNLHEFFPHSESFA